MISLVINAKNEEAHLESCITSAQDMVSEIVVVDDESTDSTRSIASKFTKNIYIHKSNGYVESARNFAINKAKGDWVLLLDADETVGPELKKRLLEISKKDLADYVKIPRINIIFSKPIKNSGWWPDYQIRFFKKRNLKWQKEIHSQPISTGKCIELEANQELAIIHENYKTVSDYLIKIDRYSTVEAAELQIKGEKFSIEKLLTEPTQEFIRRYIIWKGYQDGLHGFVLSSLQAVSKFVVMIKLWQSEGFKEVEHKEVTGKLQNHLKNTIVDLNHHIPNHKLNKIKNKFLTKLF